MEKKTHKKNIQLHKYLADQNSVDFFLSQEDLLNELGVKYSKNYSYGAFSQASIDYLLNYHTNTTAIYNALVQGGRVVFERPWENAREYCADIDLASCYGSALHLPEGIENLTKRMFSDNLRIKKIKTLKNRIQQIEETDSDDSE